MIIDLDATLIAAHSEKQDAAPTFKRGFGFHPLCAFLDHSEKGTGEPLAINLRPGNAGSNTASDHIAIVKDALAQLPGHRRGSKKILIRTDCAGGTRGFVGWLIGRRLAYSVGFTLPFYASDLYRLIPEEMWTPAFDTNGGPRDGADLAEFTRILNPENWFKSMRVIVRRERPHPGAHLRLGDVDGYRLTAFATNTVRGQLPELEARHSRRARWEDRIRIVKDTGLRNLPLHGFAQNRIWCQLVALAGELTTWIWLLGYPDAEARRWEAKRLRLRIFSIPAVIARTGRRAILHLSDRAHWAQLALRAITRLRDLARAPG